MPTWGDILKELEATKSGRPDGRPDFDAVRRKYLRALSSYTHRPVILYSTAFLETRPVPPLDLQVHLIDVQGFMECISGIQERSLDLIIHSPGGSAEAAESVVSYLRTKFDHVRVFVPLAAMSAATMIALSADEVIMGRHSQLGPIDPQFTVGTPEGPRSAPGQAILDQFDQAKNECRNPANLAAWMPILRSYVPGLLAQCNDQRALAERLVAEWLQLYMFAGQTMGAEKATKIAAWFADYAEFKSHGRPVRIEDLQNLEIKVAALEDDQKLQDAVLSVHHATMHTFARTPAVKIIENHLGKAYVKLSGFVAVSNPPQQLPPASPPGSVPLQGMSRQQRRASERAQRNQR
jgi:hypothetical protein